MDSRYKLIIDYFGKDRFKFNEPIKDYVVSSMGGPAKIFFIAFTTSELIKIIEMCRQLHLVYFLIGTGSKIAISDNGFEGLVIKNRTKNIQTVSIKGKVTKIGIGVDEALIEADSGISINKWIEYLDSQGLETLDFTGIGGSIGGSLFISRFLQTKVKSIKVLDRNCEIQQMDVKQLRPKEHIILSVVFKIKAKA